MPNVAAPDVASMVTLSSSGTCTPPRSTASFPFTNTHTSSSPAKSSRAGRAGSNRYQYLTSLVNEKLLRVEGVKPTNQYFQSVAQGQPFAPYCSGTFAGNLP